MNFSGLYTLALALAFCLVQVSRADDCLDCVDEIVTAAEDCTNATSTTEIIFCITDALGATSQCLTCVCDVVNIIQGGVNDDCVDSDPGDCINCADDIVIAANECNDGGETTDVGCVEDILGATSECLDCVCDVLDVIGGGEGECGDDNDGGGLVRDCGECAGEFGDVIEACELAGETDDPADDLLCSELVFGVSADCLECICDIVGSIAGEDTDACDG